MHERVGKGASVAVRGAACAEAKKAAFGRRRAYGSGEGRDGGEGEEAGHLSEQLGAEAELQWAGALHVAGDESATERKAPGR